MRWRLWRLPEHAGRSEAPELLLWKLERRLISFLEKFSVFEFGLISHFCVGKSLIHTLPINTLVWRKLVEVPGLGLELLSGGLIKGSLSNAWTVWWRNCNFRWLFHSSSPSWARQSTTVATQGFPEDRAGVIYRYSYSMNLETVQGVWKTKCIYGPLQRYLYKNHLRRDWNKTRSPTTRGKQTSSKQRKLTLIKTWSKPFSLSG